MPDTLLDVSGTTQDPSILCSRLIVIITKVVGRWAIRLHQESTLDKIQPMQWIVHNNLEVIHMGANVVIAICLLM